MDITTIQEKLDNYDWSMMSNILPENDSDNRSFMNIADKLSDDIYHLIAETIHQKVFKGIHATESDYIVAVGYVYNNLNK